MKYYMRKITSFIKDLSPLFFIIAIVFFIIAIVCLIFLGSIYAYLQYSAHDFERRTGIEAECNLAFECYVKIDGKWTPYLIWEKVQPSTINLNNFKMPTMN